MQVKQDLDTRSNPFYKRAKLKLFLATLNGQPAGRTAAIINRAHNEFHNEKAGFFGFFESMNDPRVSSALLTAAKQWLADEGMEVLRGPNSPSTNHECALLVDGFGLPPMVMMPYNPPYYADLLEHFGLRKAKDTHAYSMASRPFDRKVYKLADYLARRSNLDVRPVNRKDFGRDIRLIREIYNSAWEKNWGFVPVDDEEFDHLAHRMKQIFEPSLALIGFANGNPAGFSFSLPNINEAIKPLNGRLFPLGFIKLLRGMKRIRTARNLLLGVKPEYRTIGLDLLMYVRTLDTARELGHTWGELSWILEDNYAMRNVIEKLGARVYKTYRFYEMPI
jgi:GNAT superfamily N-acetyltransferase